VKASRFRFLFLALFLVAAGAAWSVWNQATEATGDGVPVRAVVADLRYDSVGCATWIPFARRECRTVVKLKYPAGPAEVSFTKVIQRRFSAPPSVAVGEILEGTCSPGGRCQFPELSERPYALYGFLASAAGALAMAAWLLRRR
jgi:hypothetical protein